MTTLMKSRAAQILSIVTLAVVVSAVPLLWTDIQKKDQQIEKQDAQIGDLRKQLEAQRLQNEYVRAELDQFRRRTQSLESPEGLPHKRLPPSPATARRPSKGHFYSHKTEKKSLEGIPAAGGVLGALVQTPHYSNTTIEPGGYKVTLYYATDRKPLKKVRAIQQYGSQRADSLSYGTCTVHIPADHVKGLREKPAWYSLWPDAEKYFQVTLVSSDMGADNFYSSLTRDVTSSNEEILVFIHGFNVSFNEAAETTAQLAYDLEFKGIPVLYSWPSQGKVMQYMSDENTIQDTEFALEDFLKKLASDTHAKKIHIIAHSMGNRALTRVLAKLALEDKVTHPANPRFRQIILAAPDVSQYLFERLSQEFHGVASHITLYADTKDKALWLSSKLHQAPRGGSSPVAYEDIDVIDASLIKGDFLNHSNYAANRVLLADIAAILLKEELPPSTRFGIHSTPKGLFYISP